MFVAVADAVVDAFVDVLVTLLSLISLGVGGNEIDCSSGLRGKEEMEELLSLAPDEPPGAVLVDDESLLPLVSLLEGIGS